MVNFRSDGRILRSHDKFTELLDFASLPNIIIFTLAEREMGELEQSQADASGCKMA